MGGAGGKNFLQKWKMIFIFVGGKNDKQKYGNKRTNNRSKCGLHFLQQ